MKLKTYQNEPQMNQNEPQMNQNEPQMYQNESQMYQNEPQMYQNEPQMYQNEPLESEKNQKMTLQDVFFHVRPSESSECIKSISSKWHILTFHAGFESDVIFHDLWGI